ncbi:MAG: UDP-N-acetylmuramate dehydrogenase [Candidatus Gastranaerophilales bacterium]|nr:UDP-N-acetylmuramate dehydrogenase [Candidatus Gastranaerophilales bacterium]
MEIELKENYDIKNMTTFKVGGPVKQIYFPANQQEFVYLLKNIKNPVVLGGCSNVLFSSSGYDGVVISTIKMCQISVRGTKILAECGIKGPFASQTAYESGLSGFEFMIGFPGTIGGNVYMNAGAHGQNISDTFVGACLFDTKTKEIVYKNKQDMEFGYRHSLLQDGRYILIGAEFDLKKSTKEPIKELMDRNLEFRRTIQPSLTTPNAGSVFKNPENDSAGRLLDKAGVKTFDVNGVKVWEKHANFIVNTADGTSEDVLELIYRMYKQVKETYTIELEPEICFIGKKNKREEELCKQLYGIKMLK